MTTAEQLHRTIRFAAEDRVCFRERSYAARVMGECDRAWERAACAASDAEQEALAALDRLEQ